jgi:hypothetical protein
VVSEWENPFCDLKNPKEQQQLSDENEDVCNSPRALHKSPEVPQGLYQEQKMLGLGKNTNLNVSAIKDKGKFVSIFKQVGEGLGQTGSNFAVEDLFTEEKKKRSEIKEPDFENTIHKNTA